MPAFEKGIMFSGVLNLGSFLSNRFLVFQMVEPLMGGAMPLGSFLEVLLAIMAASLYLPYLQL